VGVRKFRSVADMPPPSPLTPLDPENLRLAFSLMEFTQWLSRPNLIPGVRKFRSVEEADTHRQAREQEEAQPLAKEHHPTLPPLPPDPD
jgi:hypothetical protein